MYKWIDELNVKLDIAEDEKSCTSLRQRLCTLAATCFSTYDVCLKHTPSILATDDDIAIAVRCAGVFFDNVHSTIEYRLLNRHHRLLHFLEPLLCERVQSNPSGFDSGITSLWPGFHRQTSSNWQVLSDASSRWISCTMEGGQEVHYNLLTGELLIGGKPFERLPQEIIQHSTYANVLGAVSVLAIVTHTYSACTYALFSGFST